MKFLLRLIIPLLLFAILLTDHAAAQATTQVDNAKVQALRAGIDSYPSFEVPFTVNIPTGSASGSATSLSGVLRVSGQRFALISSYQEVYYDGKTLWIYDPARNEVNIEEMGDQADNVLMNPAQMLNFKIADFAVSSTGTSEIILVPKSKAPYKFLRVQTQNIITSHSSHITALLPTRIEVAGIKGLKSNIVFDLGDFKALQPKKSTFIFDPTSHRGVDIIDFRSR